VDRDAPGRVELAVPAAQRAPLGQVGAGAGELLNAVVARVRDIDVAGGVGGDPKWTAELAVAGSGESPLGEVGAGAGELLKAIVGGIRDVNVPGGVNGKVCDS